MLFKTVLAIFLASAICVGVEAQVDSTTPRPHPTETLASSDSRTTEFGMGIVQDDLVFVLVEGELQFVIPLTELEIFQFHGVPVSFVVNEGKTTWFHIIIKEIMM